jgi:uncharacterized membrane-anchored protein
MESFGTFLRRMRANIGLSVFIVGLLGVGAVLYILMAIILIWVSSVAEPIFGLWTPLPVLAVWAVMSAIIFAAVLSFIR